MPLYWPLPTPPPAKEKFRQPEYMFCHLRKIRIDRSLTQQKLAEEIGVVRSVISMLENQQRRPSSRLLLKLEKYLKIPAKKIFSVQSIYTQPKRYLTESEKFDRTLARKLKKQWAKHDWYRDMLEAENAKNATSSPQ